MSKTARKGAVAYTAEPILRVVERAATHTDLDSLRRSLPYRLDDETFKDAIAKAAEKGLLKIDGTQITDVHPSAQDMLTVRATIMRAFTDLVDMLPASPSERYLVPWGAIVLVAGLDGCSTAEEVVRGELKTGTSRGAAGARKLCEKAFQSGASSIASLAPDAGVTGQWLQETSDFLTGLSGIVRLVTRSHGRFLVFDRAGISAKLLAVPE